MDEQQKQLAIAMLFFFSFAWVPVLGGFVYQICYELFTFIARTVRENHDPDKAPH